VCRVHCLKYLVLASMLMESHVDPFNAQETQPYRSDPQIQAMTELVMAYQNDDIQKFERVLNSNRSTILEDPFIRPYMEDLMTALRTQVQFLLLLINMNGGTPVNHGAGLMALMPLPSWVSCCCCFRCWCSCCCCYPC
jgi:hypothetical protein